MKKLAAALLALSMGVSLAACGAEDRTPPAQKQNEATVTLYALTEDRKYSADGRLLQQYRYSYDSRGLLTGMEVDMLEFEAGWNEELQVYEYVMSPCDGKIDRKCTASYNAEGYLSYWENNRLSDENGTLQMEPGRRHTYQYDEKGRPVFYEVEFTDDQGQLCRNDGDHYEYDAQGKLLRMFRITPEGEELDVARMEYDREGRITSFFLDSDRNYHQSYTYEDGLLTRVELSYVQGTETTLQHYLTYTYDEQGNFLTRTQFDPDGTQTWLQTYVHTYEDGRLDTTVTNGNTFHYDANGNITRVDTEDGGYHAYSYQTLQVTPEQAQRGQMQWYYKQGDEIQWLMLELPMEYNHCIENYFLPNLANSWV